MSSSVHLQIRLAGTALLLAHGIAMAEAPQAADPEGDVVTREEQAAPTGSPVAETGGASDGEAPHVPAPQVAAGESQPVIPLPQKAPAVPPASAQTDDDKNIAEIIVTANYRSQKIQQVVGSAQAFKGEDLDKSGAAGMQDYLLQVPSVSLQPSGNGMMKVSMRGISNINATDLGFNNGSPTVGVYLNDVAIQGTGVFPDLRIFDLDRIEVLKGPQGTLYGEGSMGGAIKMVTKAPDPDAWAFRADSMYSWTSQGSPNHELRGAVNVPLAEDTLAARIVGTTRHEGGFVDYTTLDRPDANSGHSESLRSIVSWQPLDWLGLDYMFLYNNDRRDQFPVVDVDAKDELTNSQPEDQFATTRFTTHSLTGKVELPFASLTSVSSYFRTYRDDQRKVPFLQALIDQEFGQANLPAPYIFSDSPTHITTNLHSFSQELRLVSNGEHAIDWIAGAFFRDRKQDFQLWEYENSIPDIPILDTLLDLTGLQGLNVLSPLQEYGIGSEQFRQIAAYGEVTWNIIPDTLSLTGGLRLYRETFRFIDDTQYYGIQAVLIGLSPQNIDPGPDPNISTSLDTTLVAHGVLPKLSLGWQVDEDQLLYFTISRGFRSGMANTGAGSHNGPPVVNPDYVWNRELGYKSTWLKGHLLFNMSAFDIAWSQLQGTLLGKASFGPAQVPFPYVANAGDATVLGGEMNVTWMAPKYLTLSLNAGYNHGVLDKPEPGSTAVPNSTIPNMPKFTGSATAAIVYPLPFDSVLDFSTTFTYTSRQLTTFRVTGTSATGETTEGDGFPIPAYGLLKASLGVTRGELHVQVFGENLTDRRAIIGISAPIPQYTIITPRVIGVRASYDF